jgi:hypothetical protein
MSRAGANNNWKILNSAHRALVKEVKNSKNILKFIIYVVNLLKKVKDDIFNNFLTSMTIKILNFKPCLTLNKTRDKSATPIKRVV